MSVPHGVEPRQSPRPAVARGFEGGAPCFAGAIAGTLGAASTMSTSEPPHRDDAPQPTAPTPATGADALGRPFRVLGLQQVAIGSTDKAALRSLWIDLLGVPAHGHFRSERENVDEDILALGGVELDLMTPIDAAASPKVHEPALNHIGLWIDDLRAAVAWLGERGVRFTPGGIRRGAAGHEVCFIHPKGNADAPQGGCGVLIELVQAPAELLGDRV